jgi:hypothetical protein
MSIIFDVLGELNVDDYVKTIAFHFHNPCSKWYNPHKKTGSLFHRMQKFHNKKLVLRNANSCMESAVRVYPAKFPDSARHIPKAKYPLSF